MRNIKAEDRLIVALDVSTLKEAKEMVKELKGLASFFKVGIILQITAGLAFVKWLINNGNRVFLDLKYFDVQDTIREAVQAVAKIGVDFLTVHGNGKIIKAAVEGRGESKLKILAVTVLTSLDAYDIKDLGFPCSIEELVLFRAEKAVEAGCDGVITSGQEVRLIREKIGNKLLIVSPGIRLEGTNIDNHRRYATPTQAIEGGADYLVIGRPIIKEKDPREATEKIIREMKVAFQARENL
ncbi:MAG: orotidine-5'-phosphate decarboxylase [bacterium]